MDTTFSDLLEAIRLRGTNWLILEVGDNQTITVPAGRSATLYLMLEGSAVLSAADGEISLNPGNIAILIRGVTHRLNTGIPSFPVGNLHYSDDERHDIPPVLKFGTGGRRPAARLIVGRLRVDVGPGNPIFYMVPNLLSITLDTTLNFSFDPVLVNIFANRPGAAAYLTRLAEVLLVRALQTYAYHNLETHAALGTSLGSSRILRVVNSIINNPGAPWTVAQLAHEACMSRSAFAAEFVRIVGKSPMRLVAEQRLDAAAQVLMHTSTTVAEVAHCVGYKSDATFARVFKQRFGISPGAYQRQMSATETGSTRH